MNSVERLIRFAVSGDSVLLHGIFADSLLDRMTVREMVVTRNDFVRSFGELKKYEGPNYITDSTANIIFHHDDLTIVAYFELDKKGQIRFITVQQEPNGRHRDKQDYRLK